MEDEEASEKKRWRTDKWDMKWHESEALQKTTDLERNVSKD